MDAIGWVWLVGALLVGAAGVWALVRVRPSGTRAANDPAAARLGRLQGWALVLLGAAQVGQATARNLLAPPWDTVLLYLTLGLMALAVVALCRFIPRALLRSQQDRSDRS